MTIENVVSAVAQWTARQPLCENYANYTAGRHELKFATRSWRDKYGQTVGDKVLSIRENLCPAAVTAFTDGISIESWGDSEAIDTATEEGLTRLEAMVNREAWSKGDAFVLVWPGPDGPAASFQPAHAMIPHVDPLNSDHLDWAAKVWVDTARKVGRVNVYTDKGVERWETMPTLVLNENGSSTLPEQATAWRGCTDDEGSWIGHDFGVVPVCWFKLDAATQEGWGSSILDDVIPLQDGLNKSLADLIVVSGDYSNPFWYLLNVNGGQAPANPAMTLPPALTAPSTAGIVTNGSLSQTVTGGTPRRFEPSRQKIFTHDGPGPFGQLDPPDMTRLQKVQDGFAMKVGRVVGFPSYYLSQTSGDVPSGQSLRVLSVRRTGRIKAWQRDAGPVWRGVKQLLGMGAEPVQWADPMPLDPAERMQMALDLKALGVALIDILRFLGMADAEGMAQRAQAAQTTSTQDVASLLYAGEGVASY